MGHPSHRDNDAVAVDIAVDDTEAVVDVDCNLLLYPRAAVPDSHDSNMMVMWCQHIADCDLVARINHADIVVPLAANCIPFQIRHDNLFLSLIIFSPR